MLKFHVIKAKLSCYMTFREIRITAKYPKQASFSQHDNKVPSTLILTKKMKNYDLKKPHLNQSVIFFWFYFPVPTLQRK